MVLESLLNPTIAKKKPFEVFLFGAASSTVALFLSYWIFREYSSLIMVFLITLASVPLLYFTTTSEEEFDTHPLAEYILLKEHARVLLFMMALFVGMTLSISFWYVVLPQDMTSILFSSQSQTIVDINNQISGKVAHFDILIRIFFNNMRVLVFSVIFSFLYGVGALFILAWNATVIAAAIGNSTRKTLASMAEAAGYHNISVYFGAFSFGIFRYLLHGIPEILAYFVGGLAGGIISVAVVNKDLFRISSDRIMFDVAELLVIAVALLVIAALMEVFIIPVIF
ncbi:MAG TPA: stage II sporulation protein M [Candidatus Nanoarchaeia archaeon]|nr:stage II sporulation protein M [Candidatus Nanoarchaeia archaeon]